jgi:hypothetical protein
MLYIERGCSLQVMHLYIRCLTGKTEHKVDTYVLYTGPMTDFYCLYGLGSRMTAPEETKKVFTEGLYSHADAADSKRTKGLYICRGNIIGITFYGKFGEMIKAVGLTDAVKNLSNLLRNQTRRGAATEIDGCNGSAAKIITAKAELSTECTDITCGFILTHGGEEAAVYTASGTKRNMDVYARHKSLKSDHGVDDFHHILTDGIGSLHG